MRVPLVCGQCMADGSVEIVKFAEFLDDNTYEVECPKGHKTVTVVQEQKFEILFDIGAYAIADGYYREAVSSFTTSLERFYEFFIRASFVDGEGNTNTLLDAFWKQVAVQSERQFGAFLFSHLAKTNSLPPLLTQKEVELRNDVIHRGKIPTKEEALKYGDSVLRIIRLDLATARQHFPDSVQLVATQTLIDAQKKALAKGIKVSTLTLPTIVGLNRTDTEYQSRSLEAAIAELRRWTISPTQESKRSPP